MSISRIKFESDAEIGSTRVIMIGHHLILGELIDFITAETLEDTHDEWYW
ncbi:unnamed protein product [marine sediment metagenome]|uniref:Uncharacterized protein n=1 Tax=marine sediment metagenome TaxID=412755 RepID=X1FC66_9ZZZZ